jgi:hypothetical protein
MNNGNNGAESVESIVITIGQDICNAVLKWFSLENYQSIMDAVSTIQESLKYIMKKKNCI